MPMKSTPLSHQHIITHPSPKPLEFQASPPRDDRHHHDAHTSLRSFKRRRWPNRVTTMRQIQDMLSDD